MKSLDDVFPGLIRSGFGRQFHLRAQEQAYLQDRGLEAVLVHSLTSEHQDHAIATLERWLRAEAAQTTAQGG